MSAVADLAEDVGGPSGYIGFIEAWFDPTHDEHKAMRRWAGLKFDKAIGKALRVVRGGYRSGMSSLDGPGQEVLFRP